MRSQVRKHADKALDILLERQPDKEAVIRELKFKTFNQEWLDIVDQNIDTSNLMERPPAAPVSPSPGTDGLFGLFDGLEEAQVLQLLDGDGFLGQPGAQDGGDPDPAGSGSAMAGMPDLVTLPADDDDDVVPAEDGAMQDYLYGSK